MRILTPSEQREIEHLRNVLVRFNAPEHSNKINVEISDSNRDMWLNALEMVLSTQEALKIEWYRRGNNKIDTIQAVEYRRNDNE